MSRTAILVRPASDGPAMLVEPFLTDPRFTALRELVDGDRNYKLRTEVEPNGDRILYGYAKGVDGDEPERPLARIPYAEACRFMRDRTAVLGLEPL